MKKDWSERKDFWTNAIRSGNEKRTKSMQNWWKNNENKERIREYYKDEEVKKKISKRTKTAWENMPIEVKNNRNKKISEAKKGHEVSEYVRKRLSEANEGRIPSNKGKLCWNNGLIHRYSEECPGDGWVRGRI